jgi:hypothetical protein
MRAYCGDVHEMRAALPRKVGGAEEAEKDLVHERRRLGV